MTDYAAVLRQAAACDLALFCYEGEGTRSLRTVLDGFVPPAGRVPTVAIVIGSEGGFSPEEADAASDAGSACADWVGASYGQRRRRALY